jgi:hypothetical protein
MFADSKSNKWKTNARYESSRIFRNKQNECLKKLSNKLETNNKDKNIRDLYNGINGFKRRYQPRTNLVRGDGDDDDLLAHLQNILNRWRNYFCQILNLHLVQMKLLGIISMYYDNRSTADQIFCSHQMLEKIGSIIGQYLNYL